MDLQKLKIIDFEKKGNIVRFYLGKIELTQYYGDAWNDVPYDCNAGIVYDEFVTGFIDIAFPFDSYVLEPCDEWGSVNCQYCKDDMRARNVPCIIYVPKEFNNCYPYDNFSRWVGSDNVYKLYFNDILTVVDKSVFHNNTLLVGAQMLMLSSAGKEE